jgi:hypothetical protein
LTKKKEKVSFYSEQNTIGTKEECARDQIDNLQRVS